jgi:MYND finger
MSKIFTEPRAQFCSSCRVGEADSPRGKLMRCSRCKFAQYCTVACQQRTFPMHRAMCIRIASLQNQDDAFGVTDEILLGSPRSDRSKLLPFSLHQHGDQYVQCKRSLARTTFSLAYQSCDTLERGAGMMEVSLRHYLRLIRIAPEPLLELKNEVSLLLLALDYDIEAFSFIHFCLTQFNGAGSQVEQVWDYFWHHCPDISDSTDWIFPLQDPTMDLISDSRVVDHEEMDSIIPILLLILKMKIVVKMRRDRDTFLAFQQTNCAGDLEQVNAVIQEFVSGDADLLHEQERQVVGLVEYINVMDPLLLSVIRDKIPLTFEHAPRLHRELCQVDELMHLLQDCFFLTPGVRSLLDEYVEDEDEFYDELDENPTYLAD